MGSIIPFTTGRWGVLDSDRFNRLLGMLVRSGRAFGQLSCLSFSSCQN